MNILEEIIDSPELLEIGRRAIEDSLVEFRDDRISEFNRGNGFVVREKDGKSSNVIRFGPETGLRIALKAIGKHLESNNTIS